MKSESITTSNKVTDEQDLETGSDETSNVHEYPNEDVEDDTARAQIEERKPKLPRVFYQSFVCQIIYANETRSELNKKGLR